MRGLGPVPLARDGPTPQLGPPRERADQLAHGLAKARVAEAKLAMLRFHHRDEPLRKRHEIVGALGTGLLEPDKDKCNDGRQHGEPAIDRVRHFAFDIPVRLARFGSDRREQRGTPVCFGR